MTGEDIELAKGVQRRVGGLVVGIMTIKPSDDEPAVRLGVRNVSTDEADQVVFVPGEAQHLLDHTIEVVSINRTPPESVVLRAHADELPA